MKNEDLFKYQEEAMTLLTKAYKKQKFAHAYLLDGENGTGITDAAIYMAKQLICKKDNAPCMECDDCKQIDAKTHLNYIYIEPENDTMDLRIFYIEITFRILFNFALHWYFLISLDVS